MPTYHTIKVWASTYRRLKILAAALGESLVETVDRLVSEEAARRKIWLEQGEE